MTDETQPSEQPVTGLNRRDMLRRSALVGGALVWAAPAVQALSAPAFATTGSPTPPGDFTPIPCALKIAIKIDSSSFVADFGGKETCFPGDPNVSATQYDPTTNPGDPLKLVDGSGHEGSTVTGTTAGLKVNGILIGSVTRTATGNDCYDVNFNLDSCYNISETSSYFVVKDGDGNNTEQPPENGGCEPSDGGLLDASTSDATYTPVSLSGDEYRFCGDGGGAGFSHVNLFLCIDQVAVCARP